ncbi:diversity-generating retroelement protein bAvd family protein [Photobacterium rosenbergii]|uniref:Diversity-generating retroelement protein bAvd family protein n=1 Tax=Photobacterium rosenbergii TaxID=294936 RepID=A0A2T3NHS2_9GAMM|nr:four helix bundle protein [Photobacterium rosenbergii]PSW14539.1 diversity-generating retroelement protein bAvd family protein [Photobacterium rosenbergii]
MEYFKLQVWQESYKIAACVYRLMRGCKDYGFKDQISRSAVSIPSNIAKGSCGELLTQLMLAREFGYIEPNKANEVIENTQLLGKKLAKLIQYRSGQVREEVGNYSDY